MVTIYTGSEAQRACNAILEANRDFSSDSVKYNKPVDGIDILSAGYWEEDGKWIAYDNSTYDCWVEEFKTKKEARLYATGDLNV